MLKDKKIELKSNYLNFQKFYKNEVRELSDLLVNKYKYYLENIRNDLIGEIKILDNISPLKVLSRGYSLVSNSEGTINSVTKVNVDDVVRITMSDGQIYASVTRKDENNGK